MVAAAVVGGAVIGGVATSYSGKKGAQAQEKSSEAGVAEQRRQFDKVVELLHPYSQAGEQSLEAQNDLLGLNGPEAQAQAIKLLEAGPEFTSLIKQGETAILQNASATGGLRGGNVQSALAEFRPQLLAQTIERQFGKLGQITSLGQASAAGQAASAQQTGANVANLLQQAGAAQAGGYQAQGQAVADIGNSLATAAILKNVGAF